MINPNKIHLGVYGIATRGDEILLIKKAKGPYKGLLDLPGGRIEPGETIESALKREFEEEVGGKVSGQKFLCVAEFMCDYNDADGVRKSSHHIGLYYTVDVEILNLKSQPDGLDSDGAVWVQLPLNIDREAPIIQRPLELLGLNKGINL